MKMHPLAYAILLGATLAGYSVGEVGGAGLALIFASVILYFFSQVM